MLVSIEFAPKFTYNQWKSDFKFYDYVAILTNAVIARPEVSTPKIPNSSIGHLSEENPST
jgi:hypothetical protein